MKIFCQIYKSSKNTEMYLYVEKAHGLADVPEALMKRFGEPETLMTLMLDPEKKLARADMNEVIRNIEQKGFYLQMPPTAAQIYRREAADNNV
ncbi:MAG: YcgL domain-containing protein [Proteobacteria bacterium]|nr:YcgL domain-containing protein [Pseudomonadota bacterium]